MNSPSLAATVRRALDALAAAPVHAYRYTLRPLLPPSCRFFPSCSEYALEAIRLHGGLSGSALALGRLCRCHPWNPGGVDPVPQTFQPLRALRARLPDASRVGPTAKGD
jgi:putative membrane protein insertion efficiency factor